MELFRNRDGQPVNIGDTLAWDAQAGRVVAIVTRYGTFEDQIAALEHYPRNA